jgi:hypothetical protein
MALCFMLSSEVHAREFIICSQGQISDPSTNHLFHLQVLKSVVYHGMVYFRETYIAVMILK